VDDHPAMREGTAAQRAREADLEVVGTGGTAADARRLLMADPPPDVLLLDVRLGEDIGLDVLVDPTSSRSAVILLTAYDYPQYERAALDLGAAGFIVKSAPVAELLAAASPPAATHFPPAQVSRCRPLRASTGSSSGRGRSNDEIAATLGLSTKTIEVTLSRLYRRYDVASRAALATRAVRDGWLDVTHHD
jgi:DNA-binding NarL/FixJ family response regulator